MFAMAERRHPAVMLERPACRTKYTVNDNPTWELTFSVLPSLRAAADPRSDSCAGVKPGASITASLGRGRADRYSARALPIIAHDPPSLGVVVVKSGPKAALVALNCTSLAQKLRTRSRGICIFPRLCGAFGGRAVCSATRSPVGLARGPRRRGPALPPSAASCRADGVSARSAALGPLEQVSIRQPQPMPARLRSFAGAGNVGSPRRARSPPRSERPSGQRGRAPDSRLDLRRVEIVGARGFAHQRAPQRILAGANRPRGRRAAARSRCGPSQRGRLRGPSATAPGGPAHPACFNYPKNGG
jgi:hypothetical protein